MSAETVAPDSTAERVALWRAMHVQVDPPPHVLEDEWKRRRLVELGFGVPQSLRFVPVDFEADGSWLEQLARAGFDTGKPAVVQSSGVSMYLTREANAKTLRQVAGLAAGSTLVMTFMLPLDLVEPDVRPVYDAALRGARASGTPFVSFFVAEEMLELAHEAGFAEARTVSAETLAERYFVGRSDGLRPNNAEELLVATTWLPKS